MLSTLSESLCAGSSRANPLVIEEDSPVQPTALCIIHKWPTFHPGTNIRNSCGYITLTLTHSKAQHHFLESLSVSLLVLHISVATH